MELLGIHIPSNNPTKLRNNKQHPRNPITFVITAIRDQKSRSKFTFLAVSESFEINWSPSYVFLTKECL